MFGYIKTCTPELLVKENEFYRALYCGLCRTMGGMKKAFSFSLSYDFVFLALVRMGTSVRSDDPVEFGKKRCIAHPLAKRPYVKENASLRYTASAASLLLYYNLLDDVDDEKGFRRFLAKLCVPSSKRLFDRSKKTCDISDIEPIVKDELEKIAEAERSRSESPYPPADHFGTILGEIFSHDVPTDALRRCLFELGFHVGRWIYMVDALDDIPSDLKSGSYNPFAVSGECFVDGFESRVSDALRLELAAAVRALDLIDFNDQGILSITRNILCLGMPREVDKILKKQKNAGDGDRKDHKRKRERHK